MRRHSMWWIMLFALLTGCSLTRSSFPGAPAATEHLRSEASAITLVTLYSFGVAAYDGAHPQSAPFTTGRSCANTCREDIYGTTSAGGVDDSGTVYDVFSNNLTAKEFGEYVVMSFSPTSTGSDPTGSVVLALRQGRGPLLTTASQGGQYGQGTVIALIGGPPAVRPLSGRDGAFPTSGLTDGPHQKNGHVFYTTTSGGGAHALGAILEVKLSAKELSSKVLYSFLGHSDGAHPNSPLSAGYFGTTSGSKDIPATVYEFVPGPMSALTTIYTFGSSADGTDPMGVYADFEGSIPLLFGTTRKGGSSGYGTLYELKQEGTNYTRISLHAFTGGRSDGAYPQGPPQKFDDFLWGVTKKGGRHNCGTIYRLDSYSGGYEVVYSFKCGKDGAYPEAPLTAGGAQGLIGTTTAGGTDNDGTVFSFIP